MPYRPEFDIKLSEGEFVERRVREIFALKEIEVKADRACRKTKNIFIEYAQSDGGGGSKPSGIAITTAKFWVIEFYDDSFLLVPTESLKRCVRDYWKDNPRARRNGGDNGNKGVLIPLTELVLRLLRC